MEASFSQVALSGPSSSRTQTLVSGLLSFRCLFSYPNSQLTSTGSHLVPSPNMATELAPWASGGGNEKQFHGPCSWPTAKGNKLVQ